MGSMISMISKEFPLTIPADGDHYKQSPKDPLSLFNAQMSAWVSFSLVAQFSV